MSQPCTILNPSHANEEVLEYFKHAFSFSYPTSILNETNESSQEQYNGYLSSSRVIKAYTC